MPAQPVSARPRGGFTLLEMLIVIVLLGVVMGGMLTLLVRQQRFYASARELIDMRSNVRQALGVLPADLRGVSSVGGDIYAMSDTSLHFRATFGSTVLCSITVAGGNTIVIPPQTLARRNTLTSWLFQPVIGDSLFIYDEGPEIGNQDDSWRRFAITNFVAVTGVNGCPQIGTTALIQAADATQQSYQLTLSANLGTAIRVGAPIRFFRRVKYNLHQAGDSKWYLGFGDCLSTRSPPCSTTQAVSGPYRPASGTAGQSGLSFAFYDSTGAVTANRAAVARVDIVVRGQTQLRTDGTTGPESRRDSLSMTVGVRNRT